MNRNTLDRVIHWLGVLWVVATLLLVFCLPQAFTDSPPTNNGEPAQQRTEHHARQVVRADMSALLTMGQYQG